MSTGSRLLFDRHSRLIVTWIPFSNGMTDAVRHLDAGLSRHDELSLRLKPAMSIVEGARDFNHPRE